jgi:hypothetical protein
MLKVLTLADTHANSSKEQEVSATELLNHVKTGESRGNVDAVGDDLDNERVLETGTLEVLGTIIDYLESVNRSSPFQSWTYR